MIEWKKKRQNEEGGKKITQNHKNHQNHQNH